jgi:hypothetical protein
MHPVAVLLKQPDNLKIIPLGTAPDIVIIINL